MASHCLERRHSRMSHALVSISLFLFPASCFQVSIYIYEYDLYTSRDASCYSPRCYRSDFSLGFILTPSNLGFGLLDLGAVFGGTAVREDDGNLRREEGGASAETLGLKVLCTPAPGCGAVEDVCGFGGSEG